MQVFHIIDKEELMKSETVSRNAKNIMQIFLVYIEIVLELSDSKTTKIFP